jgi:HEAT repeat protein
MRSFIAALFLFVISLTASAQTPKDVRAVAKQGPNAIPTVAQYLNSQSVDTRVEAIKQLIALGGKDIIDPLIRGTRDADAEVQIRATDGLVNYYLPGYVKQGLGSSFVRAGASVRAKFSDSNDQTIDAFVIVRPEVIAALGQVARGGASLDARANACRAIGILRGQAALPDLIEALRTKDNRVMYEALVAIQKIGDPVAGSQIVYLLRDLDDRVQAAAIEDVGLLRTAEARPALRDIVNHPRNNKAERAALASLAFMPEAQDRALFQHYLTSNDDKLRASADEGLARIANPGDKPALEKSWKGEDKMLPRLAAAFGLVMNGNLDLGDEAPLRYLINTLNQASYHEVAVAYLIEAGRRPEVRNALYKALDQGTRDEKIQLSRVLSASGDEASIPYLEKISRDTDSEVAAEGLRALRSLKARLKV